MVQYCILEGTTLALIGSLQFIEPSLFPVFSAELPPLESGRKRDKLRKLLRRKGGQQSEDVPLTVKVDGIAQSARATNDKVLDWNEAFPL